MLQYQEENKMGGEKFHAPTEPLHFSVESVSLTLRPGEEKEGSFTITGSSGTPVTGFVTSSRLAMKCVSASFSGSQDEISYRFDGSAFSAGDSVNGYFRIISNQGEYKLPFAVKIVQPALESSLGPVRNLFHFANLARTNWKEAVDIFYQNGFASVFTAEEEKEKTLWRGLSARKGNMQNVEEFLIAIGRKKAVEFLPETRTLSVELPLPEQDMVTRTLRIQRNGWGYTKLEVQCEGSFLRVNRPVLDAVDFREGSFDLPWQIDPQALHAGVNLGCLVLKAPFAECRIPVTVRYCASTALRTIHLRQEHQVIAGMMHAYEDFRGKKISGREFTSTMGSRIRQLQDLNRAHPYVALYRIHYLVTIHEKDNACYELQNLNRRLAGDVKNLPLYPLGQFPLESDVEYCYRMYLTVLCLSDADSDELRGTAADAQEQIGEVRRRNPDNWWIAWMAMYATGAYEMRPAQAMELFRDQYERGSRSPVLYLEAYGVLSQNPGLLGEITDFEEQVLLYAVRHHVMTEAVLTQVNYAAGRQKNSSGKLLRVLMDGWQETAQKALQTETLSAICSLLIRRNETDSRYFPWYQKGVEEQLPITRLFDYYMMSMPADYHGDIPQMVIMYYAFQSSLPFGRNALLYRYVEEHEDDIGDIRRQYEEQITTFTENALLQHRMDPDTAVLYAHYLAGGHVLTGQLADAAVPAVFTWKITTQNTAMRRVVVLAPSCREEQYYPLTDGQAYVPLYDPAAALLLEDDAGCRYAVSVPCERKAMMDYAVLAKTLSVYQTTGIGLDLYLASLPESELPVTGENEYRFRRLSESESLTPSYRQRVRLRLLSFYEKTDEDGRMNDCLQKIDPEELDTESRAAVLHYLVRQEMYGRALAWAERFGAFGIDGEDLLLLCRGCLIREESGPADAAYTEIVHECFLKGRYDALILDYLQRWFDGLSVELEAVRKALQGFGIDDYLLSRRMLVQLLYTGFRLPEREAVVRRCMEGGARQELLASALAQSAHYYFLRDDAMGQEQFDLIASYGRGGVPLLDICRIAWLRHRAAQPGEFDGAEQEVIRLFLSDLLSGGILFPFFRQYMSVMPELAAYADETLVEYHARTASGKAHIVYHYALEKNGVREQYAAREMKEMYESVYVTGFLLFFGEQLHYYITDDAEEKNVVESGTVGQDARIPETDRDRFGVVNDISMMAALGRDEEALEKIQDYDRRSWLVQHLFAD